MNNIRLSKKAMKLIGKELDINDKNSPIIQNNKVFYERVELLQPYTYIRSLINVYNNELSNFKSENEYLRYIESEENKITKEVLHIIKKAEIIKNTFKVKEFNPHPALLTDIYNKKFMDINLIEVMPCEGYYGALKYISFDKIPNTLKEFIENITNCEYLIAKCKIDYNKLSKYYISLIKIALDEIAYITFNTVTEVFSEKQILSVGDGRVVVSVSPNISVMTMKALSNALNNSSILREVSMDIDLFKLETTSDESNLLMKHSYINNTELVNYNQYEILSYMMALSNIDSKVVFELNNKTCIANKRLNYELA